MEMWRDGRTSFMFSAPKMILCLLVTALFKCLFSDCIKFLKQLLNIQRIALLLRFDFAVNVVASQYRYIRANQAILYVSYLET